MSVANDNRAQLYARLNLVLAGEPARDGVQAVADCLVGCVAVMCDSLASADQLLDDLAPDLKARLRIYWPDVQAARARGECDRPGGRA